MRSRLGPESGLSVPGRATDNTTEVAPMKRRGLVRKHVCFDITKRAVGLVLDAVVKRLDDALFEVITARMQMYHGFPLRVGIFG
jgi:hypothetical protein